MSPPNIKIEYIALGLVEFLDTNPLLFPGFFVGLQLFNLLILLSDKFDLILHESDPFLFERSFLLTYQKLEVDHEFLDQLICCDTFPTHEVLENMSLRDRRPQILSRSLLSTWQVQVNRASITPHLTQEHLYPVFMLVVIIELQLTLIALLRFLIVLVIIIVR